MHFFQKWRYLWISNKVHFAGAHNLTLLIFVGPAHKWKNFFLNIWRFEGIVGLVLDKNRRGNTSGSWRSFIEILYIILFRISCKWCNRLCYVPECMYMLQLFSTVPWNMYNHVCIYVLYVLSLLSDVSVKCLTVLLEYICLLCSLQRTFS